MQEIVEVRWGTFAHFVRPRPRPRLPRLRSAQAAVPGHTRTPSRHVRPSLHAHCGVAAFRYPAYHNRCFHVPYHKRRFQLPYYS